MDHAAFSNALAEAQKTGVRFTPDMPLPQDHGAAYAVQAAVMPTLGPVGGFKVACKPGTTPIMAPIPADRIVAAGTAGVARDRMGVELEIAAEILSPISPGMELRDIAKAIGLRPVIELVDYRLTDADAAGAIAKLADMQGSHGLVLGNVMAGWDCTDITEVTAKLTCGAETVLDGTATIPGGSVLRTVSVLADMVGDHCGGLHPGHFVITGSLNGLPWFPAGTDVRGQIEGVGTVSVTL